MEGKVIIVSGPSGVGKDTVIDAWIKENSRIKRVVTCTSRQPRDGEIDGVDYHFYTSKQMQSKWDNGELYEMKPYCDNFYGTPRAGVDEIVNGGGIAIVRIDVQGALELMPKMPEALTIFIAPPSMEELERRLRGRKKDSNEAILKRLAQAETEMEHRVDYQHCIINDEISNAVFDCQLACASHMKVRVGEIHIDKGVFLIQNGGKCCASCPVALAVSEAFGLNLSGDTHVEVNGVGMVFLVRTHPSDRMTHMHKLIHSHQVFGIYEFIKKFDGWVKSNYEGNPPEPFEFTLPDLTQKSS